MTITLDKVFKISITVSALILSSGVGYYYGIYLPAQERIAVEERRVEAEERRVEKIAEEQRAVSARILVENSRVMEEQRILKEKRALDEQRVLEERRAADKRRAALAEERKRVEEDRAYREYLAVQEARGKQEQREYDQYLRQAEQQRRDRDTINCFAAQYAKMRIPGC